MAELEDVTLDGKPLHSLRVADLKAALEQRGLAKSGQKTALIKRLKGALMLENLQRTSTPHSGLQPNSQIGEEMSQNSFIKQYLAKQQELLRQRMEREAREAAEADDTDSPTGPDEDDHSEANDDSFLPEKHHIVASRPPLSRAEEDEGGDRGGGLPQDPGLPGARRLDVGSAAVAQEPTDASSGRIWRPSFSQEDVATPSPPRAVASLSVRVIGQPERQGLVVHRPQEREGTAPVEAGPAHSMPQLSQSARMQEESDEDEDEDDDDSDEDDEWGPSSQRRRNIRAPPVHNLSASTAQRSRRKLQPPQHIPPPPQPAHHSPLQLRQPTPPPSPPPELSFPLPDTPKQSPPDQDEPAAPGEGAAAGLHDSSSPPSLQRQESTSSSRSSSPEPPSQRRPGPLSLLVRKMESEGVFDKGQKKEDEEDGDGAVKMTEQKDAKAEDQKTGQQKTEGWLGGPADDHATSGPVFSSGQQDSAQEELPQESEPAASVVPTAEYSDLEPKTVTEEKKKEEGRPEKHEKGKKEREELREEREKDIEKEPEKKKDSIHSSSKCQSEVSPNQGSSRFRHVSPTTSPPAVTKRPRMFSEVPPPECLLSPSKPEQVSVLVSGPQHADVDVAMETEESAAPESTPEKVNDQEKKLQAETDKPASPQAGKAVADTGKAPSVLPLSPPSEEGEAERVKEKPRRREKNTERHSSSSSSSHSSSSESDSESSSSSSSGSSSRDKSIPPSKKKDEVGRTSKPVETEKETKKSYRDVKQAAVAEPTGPVAMELEERPESQSALAQPAPQGAPETAESRPDESTTTKAFAARKISLTSTKPEGASLTETESGGAASRKRRWGSSTAVTAKKPSISITTESLKSLIPDIKPLQEAVVELHPDEGRFSGDEDSSQQADREEDQGLKIRRTVTQIVPSEGQENGQKEKEDDEDEEEEEVEERKQTEAEKEKPHRNQRRESVSEAAMETQEGEPKKVTPNDSVVRRSISQQKVSVTIDDPVRTGRQLSPPRGKISNVIHVCNLVRPFTLGQLKELLNRTGTVLEEGFWIDKIKSHCYVTYSSKEEAVATREALHGVKWPSSNPKVLRVDFCEQDELDFHKGLLPGDDPRVQGPGPVPRPAAPPPLMPPARERERERERERDSGPPVVRDQWAEREREMERRERTRSEREWDRDKVRDFGREDREAGRRSRSRDRDRRRKERGKSKERKAEKKDKPEEPPAKLLDDLFRKTKAAPCIYWLPLTEEQAAQRNLERAERMKEREKRRKELQEEEDKKREEDRKERARAREREGGNAGSGAGSSSRPADGERDKDRERERERERGREKEAEKRRDGNRGRPSDSKPVGGSRRSRSRSNPSRDRRR
ncbi:apoptotic chromatin condensation inducer in the nucleus-like isoform X1 [Astyanax mexicanus]|uniref:Apoptotic chromatin condensation inducer 1 n=1 Tax=Astyanax mexicanus TaxID=7994 RepID=A0A8B9JP47_ASTMX|nr:apoptotic chromatin condensation inducer in the nucleus-like isoform X1 [Astyanax mexicanus]